MLVKSTLLALLAAIATTLVSADTYTCSQMQTLAASQFKGTTETTMLCIAWYESSYITTAKNPTSSASGLWQILAEHCGELCKSCTTPSDLFNPQINAECAKAVLDSQGFNAWTTFSSGDCDNWTKCTGSSSSSSTSTTHSSSSGPSTTHAASSSGPAHSSSGPSSSGPSSSGPAHSSSGPAHSSSGPAHSSTTQTSGSQTSSSQDTSTSNSGSNPSGSSSNPSGTSSTPTGTSSTPTGDSTTYASSSGSSGAMNFNYKHGGNKNIEIY